MWKTKVTEGKVDVLLLKERFDKDDKNFLMTMCANPQNIIEFPAYTEKGARNIAEFMAKELQADYNRRLRKEYIYYNSDGKEIIITEIF